MISVKPISFRAKLVRQSNYVLDKNSPLKSKFVETPRDEFIRSYDKQIEKINNYKNFAIQTDDLIHNDEDIQKLINELPEDMEIGLEGNFIAYMPFNNSDNEVSVVSPVLMASKRVSSYESDKPDLNFDEMLIDSYDVNYSEEGPNKQEIVDWLENLKISFE